MHKSQLNKLCETLVAKIQAQAGGESVIDAGGARALFGMAIRKLESEIVAATSFSAPTQSPVS